MLAGQALPGLFLMAVAGVLGLECADETASSLARHEGQADLHMGPFQPGRVSAGSKLPKSAD
jgi:hypothetical protein